MLMDSFLKRMILNAIRKNRRRKFPDEAEYSSYDMARGFIELKVTFYSFLKDIMFMVLGIGAAAFGLEGFLLPNNFIDGGATGISLLASEKIAIPLSVFLIIINIPFVIMGY